MKRTIGAITMMLASSTAFAAHATPADEAAVKTIVESVGTLADTRNFETLETLYADEILVDYSSLSGQEAEIKSPQTLMSEWATVMPGFDRTRHELSNVSANVADNAATASADVVAGHWIDDAYWEVDGHYDYQLERDADTWRITSMTFTLEGETGSRNVFGLAMEAAQENPASYLIRQRTRQAVVDFLEGLETKDMARVNDVWAADAVQEMPYVPDDFPSRVVGRKALIEFYAGWPENSGAANFTDALVIHPMADPQMVFASFKGDVDVVPTGRNYQQTYGGLFHVNKDGKISLYREYFDPRPFAEAFGLDGAE
jgi:ketosteroid isomerase-like protein